MYHMKKKKQKYELEYSMNTSPEILYTRLSTPGGLSEWFADDVNVDGNVFTFYWSKIPEKAEVLQSKENRLIRFRWLNDADTKSYFEFKITEHELTGDISLMITDFCIEDEKEDSIDLWDKQVADLKHVIGL
jgi:uncharacterized protein YndB with AHSA1/START domain